MSDVLQNHGSKLSESGNPTRFRVPNLIDLNSLPNDEPFDNFGCEVVDYMNKDGQEGSHENALENSFEPFIGQCFLSEEEAYTFYENYAKRNGFSIRKGRFISKNGTIKRRDFFCSRGGFPRKKFYDPSKDQRNRQSLRCGCKAVMTIKLTKSFEIFPEEWHVIDIISNHNHELLPPEQVRFLASYRNISTEDEKRVLLLKEAGLSVKQIMRVMELEKNLKHGDLPFLQKDIYNFFNKIHQDNMDDDANGLVQFFKHVKDENSCFQYAYTVDEQKRLEHIFWSSPRCFELYKEYGDVVAFDTTYKVNSYNMPFSIFIGVDNNGRTILFGCALLRNETVARFKWLMKTFVSLMKKPPKTIITDQDPWMAQAITLEMPFTKHAFCIWHITTKFSGWFTSILRNRYSSWCADFYKLYKLDNVDDFEHEWHVIVSKFNLEANKHVKGLYEVKQYWVPAYLRGHFFGGMTTTGRSESINGFVKRFTSSRSCLSQLFKQVDLAIEDIGQQQLHHTMLDTYRGCLLRTLSSLEEQVHNVFTRFAFKKFQEEFEKATQYKICKENHVEFIVQHYKEQHSQRHKVLWDGDVVGCSCKHFEFWGILYRHVLTIFLHKDCFQIPNKYLPLRWCRDEFHRPLEVVSLVSEGGSADEGSIDDIQYGVVDFISNPPSSTTKGRPKTKRAKGGKELAKKTKSCTFCKRSGHNVTTCPDKENHVLSTMAKKRKKEAQSQQDLNPVFNLKF